MSEDRLGSEARQLDLDVDEPLTLDGVDIDVLRNLSLADSPTRDGELVVDEEAAGGDFSGMAFELNGETVTVTGGRANVDGISGEVDLTGYQYGTAAAIPDSVVHQYDLINDWSQGSGTVADNAGSADMTLTGDFQDATIGGENGAEGDGTDDYGSADGPENLLENETWGVAFTTRFASIGTFEMWAGQRDGDGNNAFQIADNGDGEGRIELDILDGNGDQLTVHTDSRFDDDTEHAVIINKGGNSASDIEIYVDDMTSQTSTTTENDQGFDHSAYSAAQNQAFWARDTDGSLGNYANVACGVFEFWDSPLSQSDREDFVSRRPEV